MENGARFQPQNGVENGHDDPSTSANAVQASASVPYYSRLGSRFKPTGRDTEETDYLDGPGRRLRKNVSNIRKHIDYCTTGINAYYKDRILFKNDFHDFLQPHTLYSNDVLPVKDMLNIPMDCVCTRFARAATNKVKCPVYTLQWNLDGKRLVTGSSSGEFTLWNGTAFNFETILQAHDVPIRVIKWTSDAQFMASGDHGGFIKYWQPNMNNVCMFQAHNDEPVRGISFSPTNQKMATASDDGTARIFDFATTVEDKTLRGHGSDVRAVDWHPTKSLIATGSRDSQQPVILWDAVSGNRLATLHEHKNSVTTVLWNKNGHYLLTASRDHLIKLYDIRYMAEVYTFKGHRKEVTALAWHPVHRNMFASGGNDGSVGFWHVDPFADLGLYDGAHDHTVWAIDWHPLGHILATGSNDNSTKFWGRNVPGDTLDDLGGMVQVAKETHFHQPTTNAQFTYYSYNVQFADEEKRKPVIPGLGLDDKIVSEMREISTLPESMPGLPVVPDDYGPRTMGQSTGARRTLIKQPPQKRLRQFDQHWNSDEALLPARSGPTPPGTGGNAQFFRHPSTGLPPGGPPVLLPHPSGLPGPGEGSIGDTWRSDLPAEPAVPPTESWRT